MSKAGTCCANHRQWLKSEEGQHCGLRGWCYGLGLHPVLPWPSYLWSSASDETGGGSEAGSEAGDGATGVDCVGVEVSQMPV